mmetsp:Transcript_38652/g.84298  ORF Transcript_38652/g.84298 Transcript_38652/m.84298 type:complete len:386 (+) Transcript_38652:2-1159(+)
MIRIIWFGSAYLHLARPTISGSRPRADVGDPAAELLEASAQAHVEDLVSYALHGLCARVPEVGVGRAPERAKMLRDLLGVEAKRPHVLVAVGGDLHDAVERGDVDREELAGRGGLEAALVGAPGPQRHLADPDARRAPGGRLQGLHLALRAPVVAQLAGDEVEHGGGLLSPREDLLPGQVVMLSDGELADGPHRRLAAARHPLEDRMPPERRRVELHAERRLEAGGQVPKAADVPLAQARRGLAAGQPRALHKLPGERRRDAALAEEPSDLGLLQEDLVLQVLEVQQPDREEAHGGGEHHEPDQTHRHGVAALGGAHGEEGRGSEASLGDGPVQRGDIEAVEGGSGEAVVPGPAGVLPVVGAEEVPEAGYVVGGQQDVGQEDEDP